MIRRKSAICTAHGLVHRPASHERLGSMIPFTLAFSLDSVHASARNKNVRGKKARTGGTQRRQHRVSSRTQSPKTSTVSCERDCKKNTGKNERPERRDCWIIRIPSPPRLLLLAEGRMIVPIIAERLNMCVPYTYIVESGSCRRCYSSNPALISLGGVGAPKARVVM